MIYTNARWDVRAWQHAPAGDAAVLEFPRDLRRGKNLAIDLQPADPGVAAHRSGPQVMLGRPVEVGVEPNAE